MNPENIIREIGGGLAAVVIVAMGIVIAVLFRRLVSVQEKRIEEVREMGRETRALLEQTNLAMGTLAEPLREAVREMRARK
ncbi:hypothetical protein PE067_10725 [Paracoccus sp. DMF-8]|uniref:hypothetical protein n=1 Tax=Paracoccus sp. DMF-8 TaxID=3019445 RepID=UPI0023E875EC|nr:hypothetical protein [Paracoccus sp. DMF-8]MDF3606575.1 hypothetical protein [Paracoccus sp. DMF-8]